MHDTSPNRTCDVLVYQLNVAFALSSKMQVSSNEGRTNTRLAPNNVTLQSQRI